MWRYKDLFPEMLTLADVMPSAMCLSDVLCPVVPDVTDHAKLVLNMQLLALIFGIQTLMSIINI